MLLFNDMRSPHDSTVHSSISSSSSDTGTRLRPWPPTFDCPSSRLHCMSQSWLMAGRLHYPPWVVLVNHLKNYRCISAQQHFVWLCGVSIRSIGSPVLTYSCCCPRYITSRAEIENWHWQTSKTPAPCTSQSTGEIAALMGIPDWRLRAPEQMFLEHTKSSPLKALPSWPSFY